MPEPKVIAWVGTSCSYCGWTGKVEVTEKDSKGRSVVRCPACKERINVG
jgi:NAD-dependent SIR2 family protein deacetylase